MLVEDVADGAGRVTALVVAGACVVAAVAPVVVANVVEAEEASLSVRGTVTPASWSTWACDLSLAAAAAAADLADEETTVGAGGITTPLAACEVVLPCCGLACVAC